MHNFISMYRETLHTHFDWIGTDTWAWIPNINTGIDTWYRYLLRRHCPPPAYLGQATALVLMSGYDDCADRKVRIYDAVKRCWCLEGFNKETHAQETGKSHSTFTAANGQLVLVPDSVIDKIIDQTSL